MEEYHALYDHGPGTPSRAEQRKTALMHLFARISQDIDVGTGARIVIDLSERETHQQPYSARMLKRYQINALVYQR